MTEQFHSLQERVLGAIQRKEVAMRPRWHFVLRAVLIALAIAIAGLFAIYLASLAIFLMKMNGR